MNRGELIKHLGACIDAEQGVYESERLISELNDEIYELKSKDYSSGEEIPKPDMEPLEFKEEAPELVLESVDILEEKISNLEEIDYRTERNTLKFRRGNTKFTLFVLTAAIAFAMYFIATDTFNSFIGSIDGFSSLFFIFILIGLPIILFIFGFKIMNYNAPSFLEFLENKNVLSGFVFMTPAFAVIFAIIANNNDIEISDALGNFIVFAPFLLCIWVSIFVASTGKLESINMDNISLNVKERELRDYKAQYDKILKENLAREKRYKLQLAEYKESKKNCLSNIQKTNETRKQQYEIKVKNAVLVDSLTAETLKIEKDKQKQRLSEFVDKRKTLYSKGIVHERFRNIAALIQLKEYLEMGISDKLEGPDGAFRVYLDDLRTEKIIGSVDSLRETIASGITILAHGQAALYQELITANSNLNCLSEELNSSVNKIRKDILDCNIDLEDAIRQEGFNNRKAFSDSINNAIERTQQFNEEYSSNLQEIVDAQKSLLDTVKKSSYNQYLVQKKENLDNYLYYSISDPR